MLLVIRCFHVVFNSIVKDCHLGPEPVNKQCFGYCMQIANNICGLKYIHLQMYRWTGCKKECKPRRLKTASSITVFVSKCNTFIVNVLLVVWCVCVKSEITVH